ncbi:MAG: hypothetical protein ACREJD_03100 [Phycisphaerales bacterium]
MMISLVVLCVASWLLLGLSVAAFWKMFQMASKNPRKFFEVSWKVRRIFGV